MRTFRSPRGRHARVTRRECCAIRIGSFIPFPCRVHTASILFARRFHQTRGTLQSPCVHSKTRMLLDPRRTVHTPFSSGPILLFSWSILLPNSFANAGTFEVWLQLWDVGGHKHAIALLLQSESIVGAQYTGPYILELLFGWSVALVLAPPPVAGDPRKPATYFGLKLVQGPCARPCGRHSPVSLQPK